MPAKGQFSKSATARSVEQRAYNARPEQKKRRSQRNAARRAAERILGRKKLQGKDVHHVGAKRTGKLDNGRTRIESAHWNRSDGAVKGNTSPER